jgi:hypothetical protein
MNLDNLIPMMESYDNDTLDLLHTYLSTLSDEEIDWLEEKLFDLITNGGYPFVYPIHNIDNYNDVTYYLFYNSIRVWFWSRTLNLYECGYLFLGIDKRLTNISEIKEFTEEFVQRLKSFIKYELRKNRNTDIVK